MERLVARWQLKTVPVLSGILLLVFLLGCLVFRLVSTTHLLALPVEQQNMLHGWHALWHNPLNAPYFAVLRIVRYVNHSLFYARVVSAMFGLVLCALFYYVARRWLNYRLALFGTLLFGTNSYFLHSARLVSPMILEVFVSLGLIALGTLTNKSTRTTILWIWAVFLPVLLYIPGAVWVAAVALVLCRRKLVELLGLTAVVQKIAMTCLALLLVAPLGYFLVRQTLLAHNIITLEAWTGIAQHGRLHALTGFAKSLGLVPVHLFWHTDPSGGIATLPAVGVTVVLLALIGSYVHVWRRHDNRWRFNMTIFFTAWFAVGLGGMDIIALLPVLYLLATVGLAYLLNEWLKVFPRNPIARSFGFVLISLLVLLSCLYNLRIYFVVGAHNQLVAQTFLCPAKPPRPSVCPQGTL